jgi:RND family efflux transporter MFP subunit
MKKILWIALVIVVLLLGWRLYQTFTKSKDTGGMPQGKGGKPISVEVAPVKTETIQELGSFSGSLKARASYTLASRISGRIEKLYVHLGDKVNNGQTVAALDDAVYKQELEQARAELAVAQAQVEQMRLALKAAEGKWNSIKGLYTKSYESQAVMDQADADHASAQAKYDSALADVLRAKAVFNKAEIQYSYTQIKAAWTGGGKTRLVGELFANEGDMVSTNNPILTLVDNSVVTADIDVIERDYNKIRIGQTVTVQSDAYPNRTFSGTLARMAPVLQEASRQARAEIDIPNSEGLLKPGMYVRVQIVYTTHKNATVIPSSALINNKNEAGVFLVDNSKKKVNFIKVQVGIQNPAFIEILSPPLKGLVVTLGQDQLDDGKAISLPKAEGKKDRSQRKGKPE